MKMYVLGQTRLIRKGFVTKKGEGAKPNRHPDQLTDPHRNQVSEALEQNRNC